MSNSNNISDPLADMSKTSVSLPLSSHSTSVLDKNSQIQLDNIVPTKKQTNSTQFIVSTELSNESRLHNSLLRNKLSTGANTAQNDTTTILMNSNSNMNIGNSTLTSPPTGPQLNTKMRFSETTSSSSSLSVNVPLSKTPTKKNSSKFLVKSHSYSAPQKDDVEIQGKLGNLNLQNNLGNSTEMKPSSLLGRNTSISGNNHLQRKTSSKQHQIGNTPSQKIRSNSQKAGHMSVTDSNGVVKAVPIFQGRTAMIRSISKKLNSSMDVKEQQSIEARFSSTRNSINGKPLIFYYPNQASIMSSFMSLRDKRNSLDKPTEKINAISENEIHEKSVKKRKSLLRFSQIQSGRHSQQRQPSLIAGKLLQEFKQMKKDATMKKQQENQQQQLQQQHPVPQQQQQKLQNYSLDIESIESQVTDTPTDPNNKMNNRDYYEYLLMCQRFLSSEFIHQAESNEIVYQQDAPQNVKMIGPYVLGDVLGKGSFSKVKEGISSFSLQRVAVKIISKKRIRKMTGSIENLKTEVNLLRKLNHPNIISLVDVYCKVEDEQHETAVFNWFSTIEEEPIVWRDLEGQESERKVSILKWYMIFEFCPCTLETLIEKNGCLTEDYARNLFLQICDGVVYLHDMGVIHRDIKPANMLVSADNVIKISDFGIAEEFSMYDNKPMRCGAFVGTHKFLAPEVIIGAGKYSGAKVDIWACGVTLYNMITGSYPFEPSHSKKDVVNNGHDEITHEDSTNFVALYDAITNYPMSHPCTPVSNDCIDLLQGILDKNVESRFSMKQIISHTWSLCVESESNQYSPVFSYPIVAEVLQPKETQTPMEIEPVETTMIPYLEMLFGKDIESCISQCGTIPFSNDSNSKEGSLMKEKKKTFRTGKWIKKFSIFQ